MEVDRQWFETWKQLYTRWNEANQRARKARGETTVAFMACIYGQGRAPKAAQLDKVSQLERAADLLRIEMDAQIFSAFAEQAPKHPRSPRADSSTA